MTKSEIQDLYKRSNENLLSIIYVYVLRLYGYVPCAIKGKTKQQLSPH